MLGVLCFFLQHFSLRSLTYHISWFLKAQMDLSLSRQIRQNKDTSYTHVASEMEEGGSTIQKKRDNSSF